MGASAIPLQVVGPKIADPAQQLGQIMSLQHAATANRVAQEDLKRTQLQNDQLARAAAAEKTIGTLLSQNTSIGEDGMPKIDHVAVTKGLADAGFGQEALKVNGQLNADAKAAYDRQQAQVKAQAEKYGLIGQTASSIIGTGVNWQEKDSQKLQMDIAQAQARFQTGIKDLVQRGVISTDEATQLAQLDQNGYNPQLEDQIKFIAHRGMTAAQQSEALHRDLTDKRAQILGDVELTGKRLDNVTKELGLFARQAGSIINQTGWTNARKELSADAQSRIPEVWSTDAVQASKAMGMTAAQDEAAQARTQAQEDRQDWRKMIMGQRAEDASWRRQYQGDLLDIRRENADTRRDERHKAAETDFDSARKEEGKLLDVAGKLDAQLNVKNPANGMYVEQDGKVVPMAKKVSDGGDAATLVEEMKTRRANVQKELHEVTDKKYNAMEKLGGTPGTPREKVHAALDAGFKSKTDQSGSGQQQQGPPETPTATPKQKPTRVSDTVVSVGGKKVTFGSKAAADSFVKDLAQ